MTEKAVLLALQIQSFNSEKIIFPSTNVRFIQVLAMQHSCYKHAKIFWKELNT